MGPVAYRMEAWTLQELFPAIDSEELKNALKDIEKRVKAFETRRPSLVPTIGEANFTEILSDYEQLARGMDRIVGYATLRFSENTQDEQSLTFLSQAQQLAAEADNRTLFFKLWWKGLEAAASERLMNVAGDMRYWLEALRLEKPYTLSESEEQVINLKNVNGPQALVNLYDSMTNRYVFRLDVNGGVKELTRDELSTYYRDPSADLRSGAYRELYRVYEQDASLLGQIYQARARDWRSENVGLRHYASPMSVRNRGNDVPDEVVDTLLEVCRKNTSLFHRYFQLKARWVKMDRLRRYDIYAPVVKTKKTYEFADAANLVLESFGEFDPRFADLARKVFEKRHLDSEVRKGKMGGAFCATITPDLTPWVLMSYEGQPDDVATLAHELGHGIHSMLADHHSGLTQNASLPLAETASTFGEMMVVDRLLAMDPDPEVERDLLFRQVDNAYATIQRQAYFAIFERSAHDLVHQGASVNDLSTAYFENLQDQFGDSVELSEDFRYEWLAIPHIFKYPFYVYAYAFGQLLVFSLYQRYQKEGASFKPAYVEILAAGGSDAPVRILERAGIDVHQAAFWQGGFDVIAKLLQRLEAMPVVG
ncbi:MAG: M3 family oligoendopeptidase [Anaerolineales bacterium]